MAALHAKNLDQHVKDVLSDANRYFTKRALGIDREPTYQELLDHYKRHNIIATVHQANVDNDEMPFSHA